MGFIGPPAKIIRANKKRKKKQNKQIHKSMEKKNKDP